MSATEIETVALIRKTSAGRRGAKLFFIVAVVACVLWVGLHAAIKGRELQRRMVCASNLKMLSVAISAYRDDIPAGEASSVEWLVSRGLVDPSAAICPSSGRRQTNYVFLPEGMEVAFDDGSVIAYEPLANHREGGCAAFADGHTAFLLHADHQRLTALLHRNDEK